LKIGIGVGKYVELINDRASFRGMSREEAIELVAETLHCGFLNGKPLGEKREILERWLQKTNEELEHSEDEE
jgi:hypothetical protein